MEERQKGTEEMEEGRSLGKREGEKRKRWKDGEKKREEKEKGRGKSREGKKRNTLLLPCKENYHN